MKETQKHSEATVITGATSGIGLAITQLLAKNGHALALISRNEKDLIAVKKSLNAQIIRTYPCDISRSVQVLQTFQSIASEFTSIQYLINCAGLTHSKTIEEYTEQMFDEEIGVNLKGAFLCIFHAYRHMAKNGVIINFASIRSRTGAPTSSPGYAAAKAGVINLTKTLALQLAKYDIRVNCICPGATYPTRISRPWSEQKRNTIAAETPLKRLGTPDDIAYAVEFLISGKAGYITGQTLDVNGGAWMN